MNRRLKIGLAAGGMGLVAASVMVAATLFWIATSGPPTDESRVGLDTGMWQVIWTGDVPASDGEITLRIQPLFSDRHVNPATSSGIIHPGFEIVAIEPQLHYPETYSGTCVEPCVLELIFDLHVCGDGHWVEAEIMANIDGDQVEIIRGGPTSVQLVEAIVCDPQQGGSSN